MIYRPTSVFVVVGREEGPFSAPKALEAPMGELGPEPGALLVGVESTKHQGLRKSICMLTLNTQHIHAEAGRASATKQFKGYVMAALLQWKAMYIYIYI